MPRDADGMDTRREQGEQGVQARNNNDNGWEMSPWYCILMKVRQNRG